MTLQTTPFDPADYLETDEDVAFYLDAAMDGNDAEHFARALDDVVRARKINGDIVAPATLAALMTALSKMGLRLRVDRLAA